MSLLRSPVDSGSVARAADCACISSAIQVEWLRMGRGSPENTEENMDKYVCKLCGYVYDPEVGDPDSGVAPGTPFEALPDDWHCPMCGVGKENFEKA